LRYHRSGNLGTVEERVEIHESVVELAEEVADVDVVLSDTSARLGVEICDHSCGGYGFRVWSLGKCIVLL
jgi:hypothetical protein